MKTLLIYFGLLISFNPIKGQNLIPGCYGRQDSQIRLNIDSTFSFFYAVDTYRGWVKGRWELKRKKIILKPKLIYDTITTKKGDLIVDSLILSRDYTSDRITQPNKKTNYIFQYEQNVNLCPQLLEYKGHILYIIKNKKRQKKKIDNGYYREAFSPWYTKDECKY
ncbi:MAG: hypothetical protein JSU03_09030 [Bacteroidetes bacterium]|nr:hypothetical protein [Bacteroidota bacterium]